MIAINDAIDAFVSSFCLQRSATYPYVSTRVGDLIVSHDEPARARYGRNQEIVVLPGVSAGAAMEQIDSLRLTGRHSLCPICDQSGYVKQLSADYKGFGYRLLRTEPLMAFDLTNGVPSHQQHRIKRVLTADDAATLKKLTKARVRSSDVSPIEGGIVRMYYCELNGEAIGYCCSIVTHPVAAYVAGMYTAPEHRRKGIGLNLLSAMAKDDAGAGLTSSVLLASNAGSMLYRSFGYKQTGTLIVLSPRR